MRQEILLMVVVVLMMDVIGVWTIGGVFDASTPSGAATALGNVSFMVVAAPSGTCDIELGQGWNLVSVCANVTNTSISSIFNTTYSDIRFILQWDDAQQRFTVFSPLQANPPFDKINLSKSYFVFYNSATNATEDIEQNLYGDLAFPLIKRYNSPVYPYEFGANISTYITPIKDDVNFVLRWDQSSQSFKAYSPLASEPTIDTIDGGDGQFILVKNAGGTNLSYDRSALQDDL